MPDPYHFSYDPVPSIVNTTYRFQTSKEHRYTVPFIEATRITELLDDYPVLANAIYFQIDVDQQADETVSYDPRVGATIKAILEHYLNHIGHNTILLYNCDASDGRQYLRHTKFDRWFQRYGASLDFEKFDQEILEPMDDNTYSASFLSILYARQHPRKESIFTELAQLSRSIGLDKPKQ